MSVSNPNLASATNFKEIALEYISETGNYSLKDLDRFVGILIRGYTQLNIRDRNVYETVDLDINSDLNTCDLPSDYVNYIMVGLNYDERIYVLPSNSNIILPREFDCGEETRDVTTSNTNVLSSTNTSTSKFLPYYLTGSYYPAVYGVSGGWSPAYFKIDKEYHRIIIEGDLPPTQYKVRLLYTSSGVKLTRQTVIPLHVKECLIAFLAWRVALNDITVPYNMKKELENQYGIQLTYLRDIEYKITLDEVRQAAWMALSQSVKR